MGFVSGYDFSHTVRTITNFFGGSPGIYAGGASRYSVSGRAKHHAKCKLQKAGLQPGLIFVAAGEARLYFARFASRCCDTG